MRVSEAINLQRSDLTSDGLLIRQSKNGESRLLPIHSTTRDAISVYLQQRDRACPTGDDLFISNNGRAPSKRTEEHTSELQSLMRTSYAVVCLPKQTTDKPRTVHLCYDDLVHFYVHVYLQRTSRQNIFY